MASLKVLSVSDPQQQRYFLGKRGLKLQQLHCQLTPSDLNRPMRYLRKGNSFLIFKLHLDGIADVVFRFLVVLHLAAGPICVYLDPEVLVLLEVVVDLKGDIVLTVPQKNLEQLIVAHQP